jgi:hypothetical protein
MHRKALMFPKYRHNPIFFDSQRKHCPVCNHPVYSLAGIHPQCAIERAVASELRSRKEAAPKADVPVVVKTLGTGTAMKAPKQ